MKEAQIVCIGASTVYGVGSAAGGWPDLLKRELHQGMYGEAGVGETHEIYNLGVPGALIVHMQERLETQLKSLRKPDRQFVVILHFGANDARANDTPDGFVSSPEVYLEQTRAFIEQLNAVTDKVICLGIAPMNEELTAPKVSPFNGRKVYFFNERIKQFENAIATSAESAKVAFIPLFEPALTANWVVEKMWSDGVHPNNAGHQWLYERVKPELTRLLS